MMKWGEHEHDNKIHNPYLGLHEVRMAYVSSLMSASSIILGDVAKLCNSITRGQLCLQLGWRHLFHAIFNTLTKRLAEHPVGLDSCYRGLGAKYWDRVGLWRFKTWGYVLIYLIGDGCLTMVGSFCIKLFVSCTTTLSPYIRITHSYAK